MSIFKKNLIKFFLALSIFSVNIVVLASEENSNENSNYMRSLRYFSQSMAKEVLIINLNCDFPADSKIYGYKNEVNPARLKAIIDLFERLMDGFINSDPELNIKLINNPQWRICTNNLNSKWENISPTLKLIVNNSIANSAKVNQVIDSMSSIFSNTNECIKIIDDNNVQNTGTILKNLYTINQVLTKNFYIIAFGKEVEKEQAIAKQMLDLFEHYLNALKKGNKELLIKPSDDLSVQAQIDKIMDLWERQKPLLETAIYADKILKYKLTEMVTLNLDMLDEIDALNRIY